MSSGTVTRPVSWTGTMCSQCGIQLVLGIGTTPWLQRAQEREPIAQPVVVSENGKEQVWFVAVGQTSKDQLSNQNIRLQRSTLIVARIGWR